MPPAEASGSAARDQWTTGAAYERYMGRWSRSLASEFIDWLAAEPAGHWLDVGCGTGALSAAICQRGEPASIVGCDPSQAFVEHARGQSPDARASFVVAGADALPARAGGFDAVVSGLVLNFLPDPRQAVASMRDRLRPEGLVAAYVWDYQTGMEPLRCFWAEALATDPGAAALDEGPRFPLCHQAPLADLFIAAGLKQVGTDALEIPATFADFDDYWQPFLGGTGPAPSYVMSLEPARRERLRQRLQQHLPVESDGTIRLRARAWAVVGRLPTSRAA